MIAPLALGPEKFVAAVSYENFVTVLNDFLAIILINTIAIAADEPLPILQKKPLYPEPSAYSDLAISHSPMQTVSSVPSITTL